jgi:hypothetical protein
MKFTGVPTTTIGRIQPMDAVSFMPSLLFQVEFNIIGLFYTSATERVLNHLQKLDRMQSLIQPRLLYFKQSMPLSERFFRISMRLCVFKVLRSHSWML